MRNYEFWFVVGSQFLYGPEVLETCTVRGSTEALPRSYTYAFDQAAQSQFRS